MIYLNFKHGKSHDQVKRNLPFFALLRGSKIILESPFLIIRQRELAAMVGKAL